MNVFSLFENAVAAWATGRPCAAARGGRATVSSMRRAAFAGHLASLGLAPGDRVAVFMQNNLLYPAVGFSFKHKVAYTVFGAITYFFGRRREGQRR